MQIEVAKIDSHNCTDDLMINGPRPQLRTQFPKQPVGF